MATILNQKKRLEKLNPRATLNNLFEAVRFVEKLILDVNKHQLSDGENINGNTVGVYADVTQSYADSDGISKNKKGGDPYNFDWFGDFFDGFELSVSGIDATISSKGVGSGGKKEFLTTNNLFGLQDDNLKKIIKEDILPFMNKAARNTLKI